MTAKYSENQFFMGVMILVAALVLFIFLPELNVIVLGISFAVLFQPWYHALRRIAPGQDGIAAALIVFIATILILVPLTFFGFEIFVEAQGLYGHFSGGGGAPIIDVVRQAVHNIYPSFNPDLSAYVQQGLGILISNIGPIFSGVLRAVATVVLSFFAFYYFLKDGHTLRAKIQSASPFSQETTRELLEKLHDMISAVVRGMLVIAVFYGLFVGVGFFLFGLSSAILWGGVTVLASFIPGIGVMLIVVPGIIYLFAVGKTIAGVGLILWTIVMVVVMENVMRPLLLGGRANIHPLLMLLAILGGLSFFGPIGILLGPLVLSFLLALLEIYPTLSNGQR